MEIVFSIDKKYQVEHYKVNHPDVNESDIKEVLHNVYLEFEETKHIRRILGHNNQKQFFIIIGIFDKTKTRLRVITSYKAKRKHIIFYLNEVRKND
jgi:hypothetical protein